MNAVFVRPRFRAWLRRFVRERRGTTAIEFAIVAPITLGLALATLQAGVIYLVQAYFESGAQIDARQVLTKPGVSLDAAQLKTKVCSQLTAVFDCAQVIVELEPIPASTTSLGSLLPTFTTAGVLNGTPAVSVGASGTDMLLVVMYPWPVFGGPLGLNFATFSNNTMLLTSTQVFRMEPQ